MQILSVALACGLFVVSEAKEVPTWACALKNCALKSALAKEGPGFQDGVRFFSISKNGKDARQSCPFGGDDGPEPSKKEYLRYMRGLDKVADMNPEERRAYALKHQQEWMENADAERKIAKPSVDIAKPGVEAVNSTTWTELRHANEYDILVTFYAPWCPHCKVFVTSENAPINALGASLEKAKGPKVVKFDITGSSPPGQLGIDSVPTIYLFKKSGEAIEFEGDFHNAEALMAFALGKPASAPTAHGLLQKSPPSSKCPLKNCLLKSPLANAGPAFPDGVHFFAIGNNGKDAREACPFGGGPDEPEPTQKEYNKYMKALAKVGDMNHAERRAWARANADAAYDVPAKPKKIKDPTVDLSKPGVHAVNGTTWSELRQANKYNMLITFYAPWCPHCKAFVKGANAPIKALSESLEKVGGPKVVTFDVVADEPPLIMEAVPTVYLFKTNGQAIPFEEDPHNLEALMAFALDKPAPKQALVAKEVTRHLRK